MNKMTHDLFILYFGQPSRLYIVMLGVLVVIFGLLVIYLLAKMLKDRREEKDFDDLDLITVTARGLLILLVFSVIYTI